MNYPDRLVRLDADRRVVEVALLRGEVGRGRARARGVIPVRPRERQQRDRHPVRTQRRDLGQRRGVGDLDTGERVELIQQRRQAFPHLLRRPADALQHAPEDHAVQRHDGVPVEDAQQASGQEAGCLHQTAAPAACGCENMSSRRSGSSDAM